MQLFDHEHSEKENSALLDVGSPMATVHLGNCRHIASICGNTESGCITQTMHMKRKNE